MRVRKKVCGVAGRPRLNVFRSAKHIYAQIIDDEHGQVLVMASSLSPEVRGTITGGNVEGAVVVGKLVAEKAKTKGISMVVFDRAGYLYHGRVKALADAARSGGLVF